MNKNVKIYQYITVNANNMTTEIVKGLKTDSDIKMKVITIITKQNEIIAKQKLNSA